MSEKPKILLIENELWQVETFDEQLKRIRGIRYLGCVSDYYEIVEKIEATRPHLIFLDLYFDGLADPKSTVIKELIPKLKQNYPLMKIVAITNFPSLISPAHEAGADEVRRKFDVAQVSLIRDLLDRLIGPIEDQDPDKLSEKEISTLRLVAKGYTNKEIALHEEIGEAGVKARLSNVYLKLFVRNRTEAVQKAREIGYDI